MEKSRLLHSFRPFSFAPLELDQKRKRGKQKKLFFYPPPLSIRIYTTLWRTIYSRGQTQVCRGDVQFGGTFVSRRMKKEALGLSAKSEEEGEPFVDVTCSLSLALCVC